MNPLPSASSWPRVMRCLGSAVLQQISDEPGERSEAGTAVHAFLHLAALHGRDEALRLMKGDPHAHLFDEIDLSVLPIGKGFESEVAMGFDLQTGVGRRLKVDGPRNYVGVGDWEIPGTADVVGFPHRRAFVFDYKRVRDIRPGEYVWQLRIGALAWTSILERELGMGMLDAVGVLILIDDDGKTSEPLVEEWDTWELMGFRQTLSERAAQIRTTNPETVPLSEGRWCSYCRSRKVCPAKTGLMRTITSAPASFTERFRELMLSDPAKALQLKKDGDRLMEQLGDELRDYATSKPFPTSDGYVYGQVDEMHTVIDGAKALPILERELGPDLAREVVQVKASKTALAEAVKKEKEAGKPMKSMAERTRNLLEMVEAKVVPVPKFKEFKPKAG